MALNVADFLVIGGGIAGASAAYFLAPHGRVVVLERESQPGYHSTGRSAALYMASYGNAQVRSLTRASLPFFLHPPQGFANHALLSPRAALVVAKPGQEASLQAMHEALQQAGSSTTQMDAAATLAQVPVLRAELVGGCLYESDAFDIDVHGLHQGFLKGIRSRGGHILCNAEVRSIERHGDAWRVQTSAGPWSAAVLLNAAGAWADQVADLAGVAPIGLVPKRRSAFTFSPPAQMPTAQWPAVISLDEDWYFKPDAGALLGSPANADPTEPQDVQPEEWDIALGVHRLQEATTLNITRPLHTWAGLRSFVADGGLVGGFDAQAPGFFWVAAQGGYGVQTSPAMGQACAALARGQPLPDALVQEGLDAESLSPKRLLRSRG